MIEGAVLVWGQPLSFAHIHICNSEWAEDPGKGHFVLRLADFHLRYNKAMHPLHERPMLLTELSCIRSQYQPKSIQYPANRGDPNPRNAGKGWLAIATHPDYSNTSPVFVTWIQCDQMRRSRENTEPL